MKNVYLVTIEHLDNSTEIVGIYEHLEDARKVFEDYSRKPFADLYLLARKLNNSMTNGKVIDHTPRP